VQSPHTINKENEHCLEKKKKIHEKICSRTIHVSSLLDGDEESTNDGADDTASRDEEGKDKVSLELIIIASNLLTKSQASNDRANIGLEKVSTHTSDISNIVTNIVSNDGGVTGIILIHIIGNLSNKIGTNVSSLCEDTTTNASEQGNGGSSETETSKDAGVKEDCEVHRQTNDTEGNNGQAHDSSGLESNAKSSIQSLGSSSCGSENTETKQK
jgi:hypothetical protein